MTRPTRRTVLGAGASAALAGLCGAAESRAAAEPAGPAGRRPNIVFILIDDLGYGDLSIAGNPLVRTPNLDRLGAEGMLMTQCYDASPICSPSRAGFLTGRYPARNRLVTFLATREHNAWAGQADWLDPDVPNLPRTLRAAGYATGHFGKWHLGGGRDVGDAPWPAAYGFDESYTQFEGLGPRVVPTDTEAGLAAASIALGQGPIDQLPKSQITERFVDRAIDFIRRQHDRPWFVQLWPGDVHTPWAPSAEQLEQVAGLGRTPEEERFLAVLVALDAEVGRLTGALDDLGLLDDTLIVCTSDNGPTAGASRPGSAGPYRGRKGSLYEGGIRQPLLIRWPGRVPAGSRDDRTVAHAVDLLPTLAEAAGTRLPGPADGISLLPAWCGRPVTERPDLYWTFGAFRDPSQVPAGASPSFAMRSGRWKLLAESGGRNVELYDLEADPGESTDVADRHPRLARSLTARLEAWRRPLPIKIAH
ncbi:sulfatase-like hydrolase/transferase [Microlunatus parietis]|uniref:Arylsulfatase A-like enzyme n=1 Tax=Microlunatus parietis TaxID=682979 RepID=A0A7Y9IC46_9ACTN|nr:sulfatase-like hydrolase/transferase [Microlunatus parietis]NYE74075.1 arylsulfatase A-like enzyme [Microlunatus parietis]